MLQFLAPFALLATIPLAGIIILLYLLKLRRREVIIPSVFLWRRATQDMQANAPFQKLQRNLLLLLQLLALAALLLSLAAPFLLTARLGGQRVVLVLDASASMRSTDVKPSRFEEAKRKASAVLDGMGRKDEAALVVCSARAWVASPFTSDLRKLRGQVRSLQPTDCQTNMRDALLLAFSLASRRAKTIVYVLSDGSFPALTDVQTTADVRFLSIGKTGENVALLAFEVARAQNSPEHQFFFRLKNYGAQPHRGVISIYQEDTLLQAHRVQLKPGENHTESYRMLLRQPGLLRAELECDDALATDNTAYAFAELPSTTSVLLVSPGNLFLEQALLVLPEVQLYKTSALTAGEALEAARRL